MISDRSRMDANTSTSVIPSSSDNIPFICFLYQHFMVFFPLWKYIYKYGPLSQSQNATILLKMLLMSILSCRLTVNDIEFMQNGVPLR